MERMTEEQAMALRWPQGITCEKNCFTGLYLINGPMVTDQSWAIGLVARAVANGHLPPSALDAVWDAVEGRYPPSKATAPAALDTERRALWAAYVVEWGIENIDQADQALAAFDARFGGGHG